MKKILLKTLILSSVWVLPAAAQQFVDCSEGNAACDVLYASDELFTTGNAQGSVQVADWTQVKTNDKP